MRVGIVGTGYVGLVTGTCFAEMGNDVWCLDIDQKKIENLKNKILPIYEPKIKDLLEKNLLENRLNFTTSFSKMIDASEIIFIAVGTPSNDDGSVDLRFLEKVARKIGRYLEEYKVIANKSTVPVGTGTWTSNLIQEELNKRNKKIDFSVVSNPEFLREGSAVDDFLTPERVVIGADDEKAMEKMSQLYKTFAQKNSPILKMDRISAELTKYACNGFLATKVSFMNEMANLAEKVGANISMVRHGMGLDSRIGNKFLYPGPGYGGSCLPKDVKALIHFGKQNKKELKILGAVEETNILQKKILFKKLQKNLPDLKEKTIGIWGLSFKAKTDDMRESPSINLIHDLLKVGAKILAFDPKASQNAKLIFSNIPLSKKITYSSTLYEATQKADALIIVTEWSEFHDPDFKKIKSMMAGNIIIDGRNLYNPKEMKRLGFSYHSIGRP